jgi:hypothetical protein
MEGEGGRKGSKKEVERWREDKRRDVFGDLTSARYPVTVCTDI